jgi:hypothetical protein
MIYTIHGISASQLVNVVKQGLLDIMFGNPDTAPEGATVIDVDYTDLMTPDAFEKVLVNAFRAIKEHGVALTTEVLSHARPNPTGSGIIISYSEDANAPFVSLLLTELHTNPDFYMSRLVQRLSDHGYDKITAELDIDLTSEWQDSQGQSSRILSILPKEWPFKEKPHSQQCTCLPCSFLRIYYLRRNEALLQENEGWTADYVITSDPSTPTGFNAHTHIHERYGHPDFQIALRLPMGLCDHIFRGLVDRVKNGHKFKAGDRIEGVFGEKNEYNVVLIDAIENDRPVLRVIIPDEHGHLDKAELKDAHQDFLLQYDLV